MEDIVIKFIKEPYERDQDILQLFRYIAGECGSKKERARYRCGAGVSTKPDEAARQMIGMQKLYRKEAKRYEKKACRRIYHYVISFLDTRVDTNCVKLAAVEIADFFSERYQVYYGIHEDTKHLHIHYAINAVSYVDGKKWHKNKKELEEMEDWMRERAKEALSF